MSIPQMGKLTCRQSPVITSHSTSLATSQLLNPEPATQGASRRAEDFRLSLVIIIASILPSCP